MERINNRLEEKKTALVVVNPGTREENIYFIKEAVTSSSGAWFRSDLNPSRGTPIKAIFLLKYGLEQRILKINYYGRVVSSSPMGFGVQFEH
jgi:hypothetical protein